MLTPRSHGCLLKMAARVASTSVKKHRAERPDYRLVHVLHAFRFKRKEIEANIEKYVTFAFQLL